MRPWVGCGHDSEASRTAAVVIGTKPFAGYEDFDACKAANQDKDDPGAYCGTIQRAVEGKDTDWMDAKGNAPASRTAGWHNDRIYQSYINDTMPDDVQESIPIDAQVQAVVDHYMSKGEGFEWFHGADTGGKPIKFGEPLAWRVREHKVELRWGIYSSADFGGHPFVDERWNLMKRFGLRGTVSVVFVPIGSKKWVEQHGQMVLTVPKLWLQQVGYVGPYAASPGSTATYISEAKGNPQDLALFGYLDVIAEKARDPNAVCGDLWFHGTDDQRGAFGSGTEGRDRSEHPPKAWFDDCVAHVGSSKLQLGLVETLKTGAGHGGPEAKGMVDPADPTGKPGETPAETPEKEPPKVVIEVRGATPEAPAAPPATPAAPPAAPVIPPTEPPAAPPAAKGKKPEAKPEDEPGGCPPGMVMDPDTGECVEETQGGETAMASFQKQLADLRTMMMRVLDAVTPLPGKARDEFIAKFKAKLEADKVSDDVIKATIAALEASLPQPEEQPIEEQLKGLGDSILADVKDRIDVAQKSVLSQTKTELEVIRKGLQQPASTPRSILDDRAPSVPIEGGEPADVFEAAMGSIPQRKSRGLR